MLFNTTSQCLPLLNGGTPGRSATMQDVSTTTIADCTGLKPPQGHRSGSSSIIGNLLASAVQLVANTVNMVVHVKASIIHATPLLIRAHYSIVAHAVTHIVASAADAITPVLHTAYTDWKSSGFEYITYWALSRVAIAITVRDDALRNSLLIKSTGDVGVWLLLGLLCQDTCSEQEEERKLEIERVKFWWHLFLLSACWYGGYVDTVGVLFWLVVYACVYSCYVYAWIVRAWASYKQLVRDHTPRGVEGCGDGDAKEGTGD